MILCLISHCYWWKTRPHTGPLALLWTFSTKKANLFELGGSLHYACVPQSFLGGFDVTGALSGTPRFGPVKSLDPWGRRLVCLGKCATNSTRSAAVIGISRPNREYLRKTPRHPFRHHRQNVGMLGFLPPTASLFSASRSVRNSSIFGSID